MFGQWRCHNYQNIQNIQNIANFQNIQTIQNTQTIQTIQIYRKVRIFPFASYLAIQTILTFHYSKALNRTCVLYGSKSVPVDNSVDNLWITILTYQQPVDNFYFITLKREIIVY